MIKYIYITFIYNNIQYVLVVFEKHCLLMLLWVRKMHVWVMVV